MVGSNYEIEQLSRVRKTEAREGMAIEREWEVKKLFSE
jgi:hypothetical protein